MPRYNCSSEDIDFIWMHLKIRKKMRGGGGSDELDDGSEEVRARKVNIGIM